jgi:hypothetical protein
MATTLHAFCLAARVMLGTAFLYLACLLISLS